MFNFDYKSGHIQQLEKWLGREIVQWELPRTGFIVPNAGCIFVRNCENICTFEALTTNPELSSEVRHEAIEALVQAATEFASKRYIAVWCTTQIDSVSSRLVGLGFKKTKEISYIKVL